MKMQESDPRELRDVLVKYCYALTGTRWDAEDLAQDTILKAMPVMERVKGQANPSAYVLRMAKNRWIDQVRRRKRAAELEKEAALAYLPAKKETGVSEAIVRMLLRRLSPLQRTVFLLRDAIGLPAKETAALLGLTEGAVKAALHRARSAARDLKSRLSEEMEGLPGGEEEQIVLQAYVTALQQGDAQAIARLMLADASARMGAAVQVRQQAQRSLASKSAGQPPQARLLAA